MFIDSLLLQSLSSSLSYPAAELSSVSTSVIAQEVKSLLNLMVYVSSQYTGFIDDGEIPQWL